jgi:hypothetical protein
VMNVDEESPNPACSATSHDWTGEYLWCAEALRP